MKYPPVQSRTVPVPGCPPGTGPAPALHSARYAGKRDTSAALLAASATMATWGVTWGLHGHPTPPTRPSLAMVIDALGGDGSAGPDRAAADLARCGVGYCAIEQFAPVLHRMYAQFKPEDLNGKFWNRKSVPPAILKHYARILRSLMRRRRCCWICV